MIGAIIGAVGSVAASLIAAHNQRKQAENAEKERAAQQAQLDEWYNRRKNEDVMQLSDVQAALNNARDLSRENIEAARGRAAVMGGGQQELAAAQESSNKMIGDVSRSVAATGTARKDAAEETYLEGSQNLSNARIAEANQRNASIANAASQGIAAGLQMATADAQSHLNNSKGMFETMFSDMKGQWGKMKDNMAFNRSARQYRNSITGG